MVTTNDVKNLRDKTGVSIMQCKKALEEANGDAEKALLLLKKKGAEIAGKKGDRSLGAGAVASYIHASGNIGALVELWCETDFVAKNEEFKALAKDIAMQVTATNPEFLSLQDEGATPEDKERTLLEQAFIKNGEHTVGQMISNAVQKFGEKIEIGRFARFSTAR